MEGGREGGRVGGREGGREGGRKEERMLSGAPQVGAHSDTSTEKLTNMLGSPANGKTGLTRGIVGGMFGPQSFGTWKDMPPVWSPLPAHYRGGGPPSLFHIGVSPGCIGCLS